MERAYIAIVDNNMKVKPDTQLVIFAEGVLLDIKKRDYKTFVNKASAYAHDNKVHVIPGLYIKDGYLCLCIIDCDGNIAREQQATHINTTWFGDLKRDIDINIIETPFGKLFLCVDVDIYKPEVLRIATLLGAEIVVSCQYIDKNDFSREMILSGAWQQAQQNCIYIINSTNICSSVIGPCQSVSDLSGFIIDCSEQYPLYAELSMEKKKHAYDCFPIFKCMNYKLYKNHSRELCE